MSKLVYYLLKSCVGGLIKAAAREAVNNEHIRSYAREKAEGLSASVFERVAERSPSVQTEHENTCPHCGFHEEVSEEQASQDRRSDFV